MVPQEYGKKFCWGGGDDEALGGSGADKRNNDSRSFDDDFSLIQRLELSIYLEVQTPLTRLVSYPLGGNSNSHRGVLVLDYKVCTR
jgi:hypothetical protein